MKFDGADKPSVDASLLRALLLAFALLTRLPVARIRVDYQPADQRFAVIFYPLVGLVLGGILWLSATALTVIFPAELAAALLLLCWVLLTGALHLDGLADSVDGYFAGHRYADSAQRRARILDVMREPGCGPMAVVALVMVLLSKWAALVALLDGSILSQPQWLLILLLLPRAALLPYVLGSQYVRIQGLANALTDLPKTPMIIAVLLSGALAFVLLPWLTATALIVTTALLTFIWRSFWNRVIGGYTGDSLGALIEVLELALLIMLVVAMRFWL